jgi:hypothetical protein
MKKGSLDIAIALNYLIQEGLENLNIQNITIDELLEKLNESLNIETKNIKNMIQDNLIIGQQDKKFKPDFVNENLLDLTKEESKELLCQNIKEHFQKDNENFNVFEASKNITPEDIKSFFDKLFVETKNQQNDLCDIILNNSFQEYLKYFESNLKNLYKIVFLNIIQNLLPIFIEMMKNINQENFIVIIYKKKFYSMGLNLKL